MSKLIDPYFYFDRLTMPKMVIFQAFARLTQDYSVKKIINTAGDEFLMPDDDYVWWDDLPGVLRIFAFLKIQIF